MIYELKAGKCSDGKRHKWGQEEKLHKDARHSFVYFHECTKCTMRKIIEYTKRGNHIAGYSLPKGTQ